MSYHEVILLLGTNLRDKEDNLRKAIAIIDKNIGKVLASTEIIETKPVEFVSNNYFCNIAIKISTQISPFALLKEVKKIEKEMGRLLDSFTAGKYTDRIIDIDIVRYSNIIFLSESLEIPHHKHLYDRDFSKALLERLK